MTFDVPDASYYGALITNDSFEVLVRKNTNTGEGLFLRWPHDSDIRPDLLVQSCLDKEFGVSAKLIEGYDAIVFIKGGSLVNFIMHYLSGDIEAVGLQWVSLKTAWELVFKLEDHEVLLSDSASFGVLDRWVRNRRRKIAEESFDGEQKKWLEKFDRLCDRVRYVLGRDSTCYGGDGLYSEYIKSIISSAISTMEAQEDLVLYLNDLFGRASKPGRSATREADLIQAIHVSLALSSLDLYDAEYKNHVRECRRVLGFLAALENIYGSSSLEIRQRAIKGGYGRWRDHDKAGRVEMDKIKADNIKSVELAILKVLESGELYRRKDRLDVIAEKITSVVQCEISILGLGGFFVEEDLRLFIWNFISENKTAKKLISKV